MVVIETLGKMVTAVFLTSFGYPVSSLTQVEMTKMVTAVLIRQRNCRMRRSGSGEVM